MGSPIVLMGVGIVDTAGYQAVGSGGPAVVGYLSARSGGGGFIRQVQDEENKYITSQGSRKEVKTKGNEGEGVLQATDLCSDIYAVSIGVRKCEILLDCCNALNSEHECITDAVRLLAKV